MNKLNSMKQTRAQLEEEVVQNILKELERLPLTSFERFNQYYDSASFNANWWKPIEDFKKKQTKALRNIKDKQAAKAWRLKVQTKQIIEPKIEEWVKKNVKVGDRIWVKGTRDGIGYREVTEIRGSDLLCVQLFPVPDERGWRNKYLAKRNPTAYKWEPSGYSMTHWPVRVTKVDINGVPTPVVDLLK
jgi:hypothetical protein